MFRQKLAGSQQAQWHGRHPCSCSSDGCIDHEEFRAALGLHRGSRDVHSLHPGVRVDSASISGRAETGACVFSGHAFGAARFSAAADRAGFRARLAVKRLNSIELLLTSLNNEISSNGREKGSERNESCV